MKKTSPGNHLQNLYSVVGVCTDTFRERADGLYGAISWYRVINPLEKLGGKIISQLRDVTLSPEWAIDFAKNGKIWFMKMTDNEGIDLHIGVAKEFMDCKYVLDLDDDPYSFSKDHPEYQKLKERMPQVKKMIKMADHIVVSTEDIKKVIEKDNPYVTVIPNAIDPEIWNVKKEKRNDGKIHIGWIASASHIADLKIIMPILEELVTKYPQVQIHFAGMIDMKIMDVKNPTEEMINAATLQRLIELSKVKVDINKLLPHFTHHIGTKGYRDFPQFLGSLGLDIAIAPLEDTQFNRCKSNIKWLEHAMLEIPMVLSNVGPYKDSVTHGVDGLLAETKEEWIAYIGKLIEDENSRANIGKEAKESALRGFHIKDQLPKYKKLLKSLSEYKKIAVVTAIDGKKDTLRDQPEYEGVEYVAFVDEKTKSSTWKTYPVCQKFKKPVMNAKIHKVLAHKYVNHEYIVWIDGNMDLKCDPHELIKLMGDKDYAFFKHPARDCVYQEADACVSLGKGDIKELALQTKEYARQNYPYHKGLCELTAFIRRNTPETNLAFERWWAEICRHSERDQVSFPVAMQGERWATIPGSVAEDKEEENFPGNRYFQWHKHKKI